MSRTGARWVSTLAALSVLLFLALALGRADLAKPPLWLPRCAFHLATGWHCPGCGNTRAAHALLHGDIAGALRQNVLFVVSLPFLAFLAWRSWMAWVYPGRLRPLRFQWGTAHTAVLVAVLMVYWVLRNMPWAPFTWLAPDPPAPKTGSETSLPTIREERSDAEP